MLSVKRQEHRVDRIVDGKMITKGHSIEMMMTPYTDGMTLYKGWEDHINPNHKPKAPFPPSLMLSIHDEVTDAEAQTVLDQSYMRVIGQLLWAARGRYPECQQGCNQLAALLARPRESAWKAAMHMVS